MGSMRPGGRFLPFSKNIQRTQKQPVPAGFPQSLSGSETDISTSNENLSHEERYVIRHTARVEPQGQENHSPANRNSLKESLAGSNRGSLKESVTGGGGGSNRSSLDVSSSSYNTLIIHAAGPDEPWTSRLSGIRDHPSELSQQPSQSSPYHTLKREREREGSAGGDKKPSGIPLPVSAGGGGGAAAREHPTLPRGAAYIDIGGQRIYTSPPDHGVQEITEIPDDFLNQSSVLKHLAKEVAKSPTPRGPAAVARPASESPSRSARASDGTDPARKLKGKKKLSKEKLSLSRSQPDLSSVGVEAESRWSGGGGGAEGEEDEAFAAVLDELAAENQTLKHQLSDACSKIAKTDKLEEEVEKVRSAHEELVSSCERRERLERAARTRLQSDCRRLHDINRALREQVELLSGQLMRSSDPSVDSLRKELQNREMLIAQFISQNKELACGKERQEIEMAAQRATLQEQRTHIDILDTALTNAQANVVRLEDEARHASGYAERVAGLQRALASLQQASDRREHTERKLRAQLEKELQALRKRECSCSTGGGGGSGSGGGEAELRRLVREREERLLALEGECAKWEQRYLEEAALRQAAVSAASIPKDAKIAALEKTSQESERLMAEVRSEKIRHMDELHSAQKKCADLEGRVKELESKVAERDAMIKVLQKHTQSAAYESSASLRNNTSREELVGFGVSSSGASFSSAEGVGVGVGVGTRYRHLRNYGTTSSHSPNNNSGYESTSLRLDEQLAALDARLDSSSRPPHASHASHAPPARALCCFPGLRGSGGGGGAGKPPSGFLGLSVGRDREAQRPEEMLLLEKQGRTSQQTRSNSLPPSSLPRPPRKPSAHRQYDRLDRRKDSDGSASIASTASRGSPLPYERVTRSPRPPAPLPSVPTSASLPTSDSRESLVRARDSRESLVRARGSLASSGSGSAPSSRDSGGGAAAAGAGSLPSPSKLAMYAAARRRSTSLNKDKSDSHSTNKYRIQF